MYIKNNKEFVKMMQGGVGEFTRYGLWQILEFQNELGINGIMAQKANDGMFYCRVDEDTIKEYKKGEVN